MQRDHTMDRSCAACGQHATGDNSINHEFTCPIFIIGCTDFVEAYDRIDEALLRFADGRCKPRDVRDAINRACEIAFDEGMAEGSGTVT